MPLSCRFYDAKFPEINDIVVVTVNSIESIGAYVSLIEYNDIDGMILMSELSRRRIRSVNKLIRIGRKEYVLVTRVDQDKGYIDLSKRRATTEEIEKCQERYAKAKTVNQILMHVAELLEYTNEQLEEFCRKTAWYFDKKMGVRGGCFDIFKQAVTNPDVLNECELDDKIKVLLLENIQRRLMAQAVKIRADFKVSSYEYEGIDAIKRALRKGLELSTDDMPIKINLIAHPSFVMTTHTLDKAMGIERMHKVLNAIQMAIESEGGTFAVLSEPRVSSLKDDLALKKQMDDEENMNREVSGDDDEEDESESGDEDENGEAADAGDVVVE